MVIYSLFFFLSVSFSQLQLTPVDWKHWTRCGSICQCGTGRGSFYCLPSKTSRPLNFLVPNSLLTGNKNLMGVLQFSDGPLPHVHQFVSVQIYFRDRSQNSRREIWSTSRSGCLQSILLQSIAFPILHSDVEIEFVNDASDGSWIIGSLANQNCSTSPRLNDVKLLVYDKTKEQIPSVPVISNRPVLLPISEQKELEDYYSLRQSLMIAALISLTVLGCVFFLLRRTSSNSKSRTNIKKPTRSFQD